RPSAFAAFDVLKRAFSSACSIIVRSIVCRCSENGCSASAGATASAYLTVDLRQAEAARQSLEERRAARGAPA
ncbi:MAG TPA: hypothetical protein VJN70_02670, partial [Gemmatimonadaceae bacterium]|nr:hypothetical protein [Gemmatimonadaceae bacterium]